ncbi:hypothetical protein [Cardiobacterium valvarum]|uniref:CdiA C-terminal tRNase domain-containing protein n=1 Tax=Cardiobacterium valvarum TaxID=194702 RepID=A0A381E665_9GAMM|nr:hypothetical protein [Cardiobacterium valvarum]SUX21958.1 Uncharacterised protein [Cardiobacterium valvarum]
MVFIQPYAVQWKGNTTPGSFAVGQGIGGVLKGIKEAWEGDPQWKKTTVEAGGNFFAAGMGRWSRVSTDASIGNDIINAAIKENATANLLRNSNLAPISQTANSALYANGTSVVTKASPKIEVDPVNFYKGIATPHELGGYPPSGMKPIVIQPQKGVNAGTTTIVLEGPTRIKLTEAVNLDEFNRLNVPDLHTKNTLRHGEAGAAVELQNILGGKLRRLNEKDNSNADFVIEGGPNNGKTVDFMFTVNNERSRIGINDYFIKNFNRRKAGIKDTLIDHTNKAHIVPLDFRNLNPENRAMVTDFINREMTKEQKSQIIIME